MDWRNERYVRAYLRDTADYMILSWQARGLWWELLRKADRSGVIDTAHGARGIAALVRWPNDVAEAALVELERDGCVVPRAGGYVIPNYLEAQEATASDAQRQREHRERRRGDVTKRDGNVTRGHAASRRVTPSLAVPSDPDHASDPTVQGSQEITSSQENTNMSTAPRSTRPRKPKSKASDPTPEELVSRTTVLQKLTARNGVAYEGSKEHTRLIVARMRERCSTGRTAREAEMELRFVIGYCATELGWATVEADKMGRYLRPETLFGPETFYRYLEPARTWSATLENGKLPKKAAPVQRTEPEPDPDAEPEPEQDWNVVPMFAEET